VIDGGGLEGAGAIFGIHLMSTVPSGEFHYRAGPFMAGADVWELLLTGKGGHGSTPETAIDPTIAAFQVGSAFQSIVSREISPKDTAVVSVGGMKTSSHIANVIPERVDMIGNVRSFSCKMQDHIEGAMRRIVAGIGEALRCKTDFKYTRVLPPTINDAAVTEMAKSTAAGLFAPDRIKESELIMGSEDFSYYSQLIPAALIYIGTGNPEKKSDAPHHSPKFDLDESVLYLGAAMHAAFAWNFLEKR